MICAIDGASVHRICSGQGIPDLSVAVKELIENAIDAGATQIEIKLKNYGFDSFEVSDNGSGVKREDFNVLVRKYHTSKIQTFADLQGVASFGFRGEALSSLSELCGQGRLVILTRAKDEAPASRLTFKPNGDVLNREDYHRKQGTSVLAENLFEPLPVRRKDFKRNLKRHYAKLLHVIQAYALIATDVKISCSNFVKGRRMHVLSTKASSEMKGNIVSVYGAKMLEKLQQVDIKIAIQGQSGPGPEDQKGGKQRAEEKVEESASQKTTEGAAGEDGGDGEEEEEDAFEVRIKGYVSKAEHGIGKSTAGDRQFLFVNGRPVSLTKAIKAVNDSWRRHDLNHKPGFILNLILPSHALDVNVTPDKREVFIIQQDKILSMMKEKLEDLWKPSVFKYQVKSIDEYYSSTTKPPASSSTDSPTLDTGSKDPDDGSKAAAVSLKTDTPDQSSSTDPFGSSPESATRSTVAEKTQIVRSSDAPAPQDPLPQDLKSSIPDKDKMEDNVVMSLKARMSLDDSTPGSGPVTQSSTCCLGSCTKRKPDVFGLRRQVKRLKAAKSQVVDVSDLESSVSAEVVSHSRGASKKRKSLRQSAKRPPGVLTFGGLTSVEQAFTARMEEESRLSSSSSCTQMSGVGELGVDNADHVTVADQLEKVFRKEDFLSAQVLGQFNLGFIIARVHNELFILDQHACDEIYNFERLQGNTKVHEQRLIKPLPLDLSASEYQIVQDNLAIFQANGFQFKEETTEDATQLCLVAVPQPDNFKTQFGADDVKELASVLRNNPRARMEKSKIPLLPKTRAMYASKACRSSIMIGDALQKGQMNTVVKHLASLERPWNCPHGRPTMRHLVDLVELYKTKAANNEALKPWQQRISALMKSALYFTQPV